MSNISYNSDSVLGDESPKQDFSLNCPPIRFVEIGIGEKLIIASDFFISSDGATLPPEQVTNSRRKFIETLNGWDGPGAVVIAGNLLDLLSGTETYAGSDTWDCDLFRALQDLTQRTTVTIYVLPGFRDARLAYDRPLVENLMKRFPFRLALKLELNIAGIEGTERVLVTSGREFDPTTKAIDPYSPIETPWASHLLSEFWPRQRKAQKRNWLEGAEYLVDQRSLGRFAISRFTYRKAIRFLPWVLLPLILSFIIKVPLVLSLPLINRFKYHAIGLGARLAAVGFTTVIDLALLVVVLFVMLRRSYSHFIARQASLAQEEDVNLNARLSAATCLEQGIRGVIVGHFLSPELARMGSGFFACTGSVSPVCEELPAKMGLPSIFRIREQTTWIELEVGASLHARLFSWSYPQRAGSLIERLLIAKRKSREAGHGQLASFPEGKDYRFDRSAVTEHKTPRRISSVAIFLAGAVNLASALTPPIRSRLHLIEKFVPITVPRTADALVAMASIGLLFLAGGVRRGQKQAWILTLGIAIGTATLDLIKGGDFEEALLLIILAIYLIATRSSFKAPMDRPSFFRGVRALLGGTAAIVLFSTLTIYGYLSLIKGDKSFTILNAVTAVSERMVGLSRHHLPGPINQFASPPLELSGLSIAAIALFLIFRPAVDRSRGLAIRFGTRSDRDRARSIVEHHSRGTLDYFALRDDKRYFFAHGCVVAYANYGSIALVSPDPLGPGTTQNEAWKDFLSLANSKGWIVAVLGADEEWLGAYQATGFHSIYVGDEAIVTLSNFHMEGKRHKGLRQAVGRIKKYGYYAEFYDPSTVNPLLAHEITDLMGQSRKGDVERGFSMTLGRLLDPSDKGLLLTVCKDKDSNVVGFCQWVPAPGIKGYSLDLMRRDLGAHPNGLTDFMIVSTIEYLREKNFENLSLNFATMRAVLSGEMDSLTQRVEKWFLKRMSESMQIESLWRFNSKFDPTWHPRYVVYDNIEHTPAIAVAIARAESFWELPIIGRLLSPGETSGSENASMALEE